MRVDTDRAHARATEGCHACKSHFAVVTFIVTACADAEAGFHCRRGMGSFAKVYNFAPRDRIGKIVSTRSANEHQRPSRSASPKGPVASPVKSARIVSAAKPTGNADTAVSTPTIRTPIATPTDTCLVKEYLDTGAVRFKNSCTHEWAINSTDGDKKTSTVGHICLTKQNSRDGVVMFKDVCTGEWAMNTAKQMALAHAQ